MKKKYIIFSIVVLVLFMTLSICFDKFKTTNIYIEDSSNNQIKITKGISMNLEQTAGSGDYKQVTQSGWPTEGYKFNTELSRCENGSTLSWDDTKKAVIMQGNVSDKCYVYFDVWIPTVTTFSDYVISKYTGTQGENSIYYHDSTLANGVGDNSYRYAGPSESVNNFVCFGSTTSPCPKDNLYRIIGVIDDKVKLIKYDYATSDLLGTDGDYYSSMTPDSTYKGSLLSIDLYYWNYKNDTTINSGYGSNIWNTSLLNKTNLNTNFLNNIGSTWASKIITTTWKVGGGTVKNIEQSVPSTAYKYEVGANALTTTYDAKIGLMYVSDYYYAASPSVWTLVGYNLSDSTKDYSSATSNNWMYMGYDEWTISPCLADLNYEFKIFAAGSVSSVGMCRKCTGFTNGLRPSFNLESSVTYVSGSGSMSDPIIID